MLLEPIEKIPDKDFMGMEEVNRTLVEIRERLRKIETLIGVYEEDKKEQALELRRVEEKFEKRISTLEKAHWKALGILAAGAVMVNWLYPVLQKLLKP